jgi:Flp pilus assembly protein TadD
MAKKKSDRQWKGFGSPTSSVASGVQKLQKHLHNQDWQKANEVLQDLQEQFPKHPDVLAAAANVAQQQGNTVEYEHACKQLLEVSPHNPDAALGLAGGYLANQRPMLALKAFHDFLDQYPDHDYASQVQETVERLESEKEGILSEMGLEGENAEEIARLHEQVMSLIAYRQIESARAMAEKLVQRAENFIPAHNNFSLCCWMDNDAEAAIAAAAKVLEIDENNVHALSNLARFCCLSGDTENARYYAERLKSIPVDNTEHWIKQMEAFAYLGDDENIAEIYETAKKHVKLEKCPSLLLHLAAAAQMRLGRMHRARDIWQRALKNNRNETLARENLEDAKKSVSERHAPWFFTLESWIDRHYIYEMQDMLKQRSSQASEDEDDAERERQVLQEFLQKYPSIEKIIPMLLDRGDPKGRQFALYFASTAKTPELLQALKDFALSSRGPDDMRYEAARVASDYDYIPAGSVRMWLRGQWQDIYLMNMAITTQPRPVNHASETTELLTQAIQALHNGEGTKAEPLLKEALEQEPEAPDLRFNLAMAYKLQDREEEYNQLIEALYQNHPNYTFGRIAFAELRLREGRIEAAREILSPMLGWKEFHVQEWSFFCHVQVEAAAAEDNLSSARNWLDMWEQANPDDPGVQTWKNRLSQLESLS